MKNFIRVVCTGNLKALAFTLLLTALFAFPALAQNVYQTTQNGNWSASSTWINNNKPGDIITNGETIIIDHNIDFGSVKITNGGNIIINAAVTGLQLDMNSGSSLTVNSSTTITNLGVNNGTINLNAPLASSNFSATGTTIYTSDPNLLIVDPTILTSLQNSGAIKTPVSLPVTLISFTSKTLAEGNLLSWTTTKEYHSAYIALERSADGKNFEEINRQASTNNFNGQSTYQYQDARPLAGVNFYRLRQADVDGTVSYSKIISSAASPFKIYTGEQVIFNAPVSGKASIINLAGAVVTEKALIQQTEISLTHLPSGMYVLIVEQGNQVYKQKIVL